MVSPLNNVSSVYNEPCAQVIAAQPRLVSIAARHITQNGLLATAVPSLSLARADHPFNCMHTDVQKPAIGMILQGSKQMQLGDQSRQFDSMSYLVTSVSLPMMGRILEATPDQPYFAIRLDIDLQEVTELVLKMKPEDGRNIRSAGHLGIGASAVCFNFVSALERLLGLLDHPEDIPVMADLYRRELLYRALQGNMGYMLRQMVTNGTQAQRIRRAIEWLETNFAQPLRVKELAEDVHLSESAFYQNFKAVTTMSPLQYQKRLRLYEARRIMFSEGVEVSTASYRVGYESPSQFSREYARLFSLSPRADIEQLRSDDVAAGERPSYRA